MNRSAKALLTLVSLVCAGMAQTSPSSPRPQQRQTGTTNAPVDKAAAYYHFAMGRLYAELGQAEGSKETINKAIQHYQDALKADPTAGIIFEELTDLYIQTGQLQSAVSQAEDLLKQNPDNVEARRMLGRIYTRMIGNPQTGKINDTF